MFMEGYVLVFRCRLGILLVAAGSPCPVGKTLFCRVSRQKAGFHSGFHEAAEAHRLVLQCECPRAITKERKSMTQTIHAIYENGVFRPIGTVDLPERCEVEVEVCQLKEEPKIPSLDDVYAILSKRYNSGESDVAAGHNEHQP
jgi:predicted DNA-binding antitoxin AbrB/MazE fold protein